MADTLKSVQLKVQELKKRQLEMSQFPLDFIFDIFEGIKNKWKDENYLSYKAALKVLPHLTNFSPEMIKMGLNELSNMFDPEVLKIKIATEFQGVPRGLGYKYCDKTNRALKFNPLGTILHVLSGNVFLVGPGSLIESILTGNTTLIKMSSAETFFMPLFLKSIIEVEKELNLPHTLSNSIKLLEYSSKESAIINYLKNEVDGILVWGGEEAIKGYRDNLPARVRFINFGPKLSLSILEKAQDEKRLKKDARLLSYDLAIWDQNACTAPQVAFVHKDDAETFLSLLHEEMKHIEEKIPAGTLDENTAADIRKLRTHLEISHIVKDVHLKESSPYNLKWTIYIDHKNKNIETSPLNRTLKIIPYRHFEEIKEQIKIFKSYIQTVGVSGLASTFFHLSKELGELGILRIMPLGEMSGGDIDDPHDGLYDLPQLMNLVVTKIPRSLLSHDKTLDHFVSEKEKEEILVQNLRVTLKNALKAPFYKEKLKTVNPNTILTLKDFNQLPILSKKERELNMPPHNFNLCTVANPTGGAVTRTGGSTGAPKFSWFSDLEWDAMIKNAAKVFKNAGFNKNDRIANCLMAGDLYGSFISFFDANLYLGMTTFPFAGNVTPETFLLLWDQFKLNSIQGVPSFFIPLLKQIKEIRKDFTLEKVMYAGQPMNASDRAWLKNELQTKVISSIIGTTEAGQIAYQDSSCEAKEHFLIDDYTYIEIVDEEGQPCPVGVKGRILVTTLQKNDFPLIRFDIGDQGEFLQDSNEQSFRPTKIKYHGRHDDIIVVGMMNMAISDFEKCLDSHNFNYSALQLLASSHNDVDHLDINIEVDNPKDLDPNLVNNLFLENISEIKHQIKDNYLKLNVNFHKVGTLERNTRTGKIKNIIDQRDLGL